MKYQGSLEDLDRKASLGSYQCGAISQLIEYLVTPYSDLLVIPGGSNRLCFVVIFLDWSHSTTVS